MKTLWTCMIHDGDYKFLQGYIDAINQLTVKPDAVRFFCSGSSEECEKLIVKARTLYSFEYRLQNDGFNRGLNSAVNYAIKNNFDWLITMTIRCKPLENWLEELGLENQSHEIGMITTLIVNHDQNKMTFNLGHNISPSGGCFDFGSGLNTDVVIKKATTEPSAILGPCTGAGVYKTIALVNNENFIESNDPVNPSLFKSYNCDAMGYLVLANGFTNYINPNSISLKSGLQNSTSNNPNSLAINMNLEISRMTNIFTYFEDCKTAYELYKNERLKKQFSIDDSNFKFKESDILMIRLFAQRMARIFAKHKLRDKLARHHSFFSSTKDWFSKQKKLLT